MNSPLRTESALDSGQTLVTELLREPVKTAVREALEAESATVRPESADADDPADEQSGRSKLGPAVALLTVAGIAYLVRRRRRDGDSNTSVTRPSDVDEGTTAGDRVEGEAPTDMDG